MQTFNKLFADLIGLQVMKVVSLKQYLFEWPAHDFLVMSSVIIIHACLDYLDN